MFPQIETAVLPENKTTIFILLSTLQQQIWKRSKQFFVSHIRAHSNLPGPLHTFNQEADLLTQTIVASAFEDAKASHAMHHQNATALRYQFHIPRKSAQRSLGHVSFALLQFPLCLLG